MVVTYAARVHFLDKSVAAKATGLGAWFVLRVPPGLYVRDTEAWALVQEKSGDRPQLRAVGAVPCDSEPQVAT